jgi:ribosomal-protein-alanine N-acetyltransferase
MVELSDVSLRLVRPEDAASLSRLQTENRAYLLSGGPTRSDEYVSVDGQREVIRTLLEDHRAGTCVPFVIETAGDVVGQITLRGIVRGAFQSAFVGYWVARSVAGRGVASRALGLAIEHAFTELGLHRVQAETTLTNEASVRVLLKAGFEQFGVAPDYLRIDGRWQDHRMFQVINAAWSDPDDPAPGQVKTR